MATLQNTPENNEILLPLYEVLNDDADDCDLEWPLEFGDPGITGGRFIEIAQKAGVSLMYTVRAALYCFLDDHKDTFIADPRNLKYRNSTREEERVMNEIGLEKAELEKALRKVRLQVAPGKAHSNPPSA